MSPMRLHPGVGLTVAVIAVVAGWWMIAPQAIGGPMAYLSVQGTSMTPAFGPGDLVVVRDDPPYQPGDVVAYRTPRSSSEGEPRGPVIVHRVVAVSGDRLVLRGDANDHDDALRPTLGDVVGRQVAVVPGAGGVVNDLGQLQVLLAVMATGLVGWAGMRRTNRRRRTGEPVVPVDRSRLPGGDPAGASGEGAGTGSTKGEGDLQVDPLQALAVRRPGPPWLWAVLALAVGLAGVVVAERPTSAEVQSSTPWMAQFSFGWDASASDDPLATVVYGEEGLRTGDTVFVSVSEELVVQMTSTLATSMGDSDGSQTSLTGPGILTAEATVVSTAGWRRSVATLESQPLEGGRAEGVLVVNLPAAWATASTVGAVAGRLGEVRLEVVASLTTSDGAVDAVAKQAFVLDEFAAEPLPPEAVTSPDGGDPPVDAPTTAAPDSALAGAGGGPDGDPGDAPSGSVAVEGVTQMSEMVPGSVAVGPLSVPRGTAVILVVAAALMVIVGGGMAIAATSRARRRGEGSLLVTRHRWSLVPLNSAPQSTATEPVEVATFGALRRVAGAAGQPIGVTCVGDRATFWVTDGTRIWRYRAAST